MYWAPTLRGVIDRRILVNFRIVPEALESVLPDKFRPRTVAGPEGPRAIGGICCIRLRDMRLRGFPAAVGVTSENAAHRIGVEWDEDGTTKTGVYVPRRDTSSRLNSLVGSHTFGRHYHADFTVAEDGSNYELRMENRTEGVSMSVSATETDTVPPDSIFPNLSAAFRYHECGAIGYCPSPDGTQLNGIELATDEWHVNPLAVEEVHASFFETEISADAVTFDNALLMRDIGHEWRPRRSIDTPETA